MVTLSQAFRITKNEVVAFVGAGGKTSAMFTIARELSPALVSTSTHLGEWQAVEANQHIIWEADSPMPDLEARLGTGVTLVTGELDLNSHRFHGLEDAKLKKLQQVAGYHDIPLLIEADGSRKKPLKAPGEYEPAIPGFVNLVVVVAGLSGLLQPLGENSVFNVEEFCYLAGLGSGDCITPQALAKVLSSDSGGLKNIPSHARRIVLLNQADTILAQSQANEIGQLLLSTFDTVVVSSLKSAFHPVISIREKIAAVILAAGASSRFGQAKQLLEFHGKPFVRVVAETALKAGLHPVIVVSGANSKAVSAVLEGQNLSVIHNSNWRNGQSASIKTGIGSVPKNVGGAIILLVDQPQVTVELLLALIERHAQDIPPIVAPYVFDQRANPVLFDRVTFPFLQTISGDTGGRAIFSKFSPKYVNWYDRRILIDVDTMKDYQQLIDGDTLV